MGWGLVSEHDPLDCAPAQEVEEVEELPAGTALQISRVAVAEASGS